MTTAWDIREEVLTCEHSPQTLVTRNTQVKIGNYGQFSLPLVLKVEDTLEWLRVNPGELKIQQVVRNVVASAPLARDLTHGYSKGPRVALNIGAHECFFCLIFALTGHRVYAVEPLPLCAKGIKESFSLYPREICDMVSLFNYYVSERPLYLDTPADICSGTFHGEAQNVGRSFEKIGSIRVDDLELQDGHIEFFAIDTEGAELSVLASAKKTFETKIVKNMVFEYTPKWYRERTGFTLERAIETLETIVELQGYNCILLSEYSHSVAKAPPLDFRAQLTKDWNTTTLSQTDIFCTRCKRWLQVRDEEENSSPSDIMHQETPNELCIEYA